MTYRPPNETLVACIRLPRFPVQVERRRHREAETAEAPLVLLTAERTPRVYACCREAEALGIREGMPLREIMATAPQSRLLTADPYLYAEVFDRLLTDLESLTPDIEPAGPGTAYLGIPNCQLPVPNSSPTVSEYSGGSEICNWQFTIGNSNPVGSAIGNWQFEIGNSLDRRFHARIGVARGKFLAWAATRTAPGAPGARFFSPRACWVEEDAREAFLCPLPADWLPVSAEMRRRLELLGLGTLGEVAALPLSAMLAQFGPEGRRAWRLARGLDDEPLRPRRPEPEISETLHFNDPEATVDGLLIGVSTLLEAALSRPERKGRGVRQVRLDARLESGLTWSQTVTLRRAGTRIETLFPPLRYRLDRVRPAEAVESLTLTLAVFTPSLSGQQSLFPEPGEERRARLLELLRELNVRTGKTPVHRIVGVEPWSRIPERRYQLIGYDP